MGVSNRAHILFQFNSILEDLKMSVETKSTRSDKLTIICGNTNVIAVN